MPGQDSFATAKHHLLSTLARLTAEMRDKVHGNKVDQN